jgi:hypothetical protein
MLVSHLSVPNCQHSVIPPASILSAIGELTTLAALIQFKNSKQDVHRLLEVACTLLCGIHELCIQEPAELGARQTTQLEIADTDESNLAVQYGSAKHTYQPFLEPFSGVVISPFLSFISVVLFVSLMSVILSMVFIFHFFQVQ